MRTKIFAAFVGATNVPSNGFQWLPWWMSEKEKKRNLRKRPADRILRFTRKKKKEKIEIEWNSLALAPRASHRIHHKNECIFESVFMIINFELATNSGQGREKTVHNFGAWKLNCFLDMQYALKRKMTSGRMRARARLANKKRENTLIWQQTWCDYIKIIKIICVCIRHYGTEDRELSEDWWGGEIITY